jgi:molybdopterin molybdotransferase
MVASMSTILSVSEALEKLLAAFQPVGSEEVELSQALSRVLAQDIRARFDLPIFDYSAMDGFAVLSADVTTASHDNPVSLEVVADIPAGHPYAGVLSQGQAARITTGAPLPAGAEAVIPLEETDQASQPAGSPLSTQVQVFRSVKAGDFIRRHGKDARVQDLMISRGTRIRPQEVGLLAMLGIPRVRVHRRPRVAILPTGDELLHVGDPLTPGKIYESNTFTIAAQVAQAGGEAIPLGLIADRFEAVKEALDQAAASKVELILASAGVSVGTYDFVRAAVEKDGQLSFWRVNMRPGKPLAFGSYRGTPFVGLPGNPVSAFVGFEVFLRPALLKMGGEANWGRMVVCAELLEEIESDGRESYFRAVVTYQDGRAYARLAGNQDSGNLRSLIQANALLIMPNEVKCLPIGAEVQTWLI